MRYRAAAILAPRAAAPTRAAARAAVRVGRRPLSGSDAREDPAGRRGRRLGRGGRRRRSSDQARAAADVAEGTSRWSMVTSVNRRAPL